MLLGEPYFSFCCGLFLTKVRSSFSRCAVKKSQKLSEELQKIRPFKVPYNVKFPGAIMSCLKKRLTNKASLGSCPEVLCCSGKHRALTTHF